MTYTITITVNEADTTTDVVLRTVHFLSETLDNMQMGHTIECHKDTMKLANKACLAGFSGQPRIWVAG